MDGKSTCDLIAGVTSPMRYALAASSPRNSYSRSRIGIPCHGSTSSSGPSNVELKRRRRRDQGACDQGDEPELIWAHAGKGSPQDRNPPIHRHLCFLLSICLRFQVVSSEGCGGRISARQMRTRQAGTRRSRGECLARLGTFDRRGKLAMVPPFQRTHPFST